VTIQRAKTTSIAMPKGSPNFKMANTRFRIRSGIVNERVTINTLLFTSFHMLSFPRVSGVLT